MWHDYTATCQNVTLRPLEEGDIEYLRQWRNNKAESKFLSQVDYITEEAQKKWFINCMSSDDNITFAIVDNVRNVFTGSIALYNFSENAVELGRLMVGDPDSHGRHIGRNAVTALSEIAINELGKDEVFLHVYKDNLPAVTVYKQAGYKIVDEHVCEDGKIELLMSLKPNKEL